MKTKMQKKKRFLVKECKYDAVCCISFIRFFILKDVSCVLTFRSRSNLLSAKLLLDLFDELLYRNAFLRMR